MFDKLPYLIKSILFNGLYLLKKTRMGNLLKAASIDKSHKSY